MSKAVIHYCVLCDVSMGFKRGKYCPRCREEGRKIGRSRADERTRIRIASVREILDRFKVSMGCQVCGYRRRSCSLAFHHTKPNKKSKETARAGIKPEHFLSKPTRASLEKELATCAIVCHNCHAEHHSLGEHSDIMEMGVSVAMDLLDMMDKADADLVLP